MQLKNTLFTLMIIFSLKAYSQCVVNSTDGYKIAMYAIPTSVVVTSGCPNAFGFNYNINLNYYIYFYGSNIPASMYLLQGRLNCGGQDNFFDTPNNGGVGIITSQSNPYVPGSGCATATVSNLNCNTIVWEVDGPNLSFTSITCPITALPIELVSFDAIIGDNIVNFDWTTASENNNDYFVVERSTDGFEWEVVANVDGTGNSTSLVSYKANDNKEVRGIVYYKLKQVDFDGNETNSAIRTVHGRIQEGETTLYPNPTQNVLVINERDIEIESIEIQTINGATLNVNIQELVNVNLSTIDKVILNLQHLADGIYFIKTSKNTVKFVKNT
jgi:Secretion system C-terminal sorting domain